MDHDYVVVVRGQVPPDLGERISRVHAEAVVDLRRSNGTQAHCGAAVAGREIRTPTTYLLANTQGVAAASSTHEPADPGP